MHKLYCCAFVVLSRVKSKLLNVFVLIESCKGNQRPEETTSPTSLCTFGLLCRLGILLMHHLRSGESPFSATATNLRCVGVIRSFSMFPNFYQLIRFTCKHWCCISIYTMKHHQILDCKSDPFLSSNDNWKMHIC